MKPYNYSEIKTVSIPLEKIELISENNEVPTCSISFDTEYNFATNLTREKVLDKIVRSVESCITLKQLHTLENFTQNHFLLDFPDKSNIGFMIRNQARKILEK